MNIEMISQQRERLIGAISDVGNYISTFKSINKRWGSAITSGMIEVGRMENHASQLFTPLIRDMDSTKDKYSQVQGQLLNAILFEMVKKIVQELSDTAKFAINILKRNLFERTADVGYLATDSEIVSFLKYSYEDCTPDSLAKRAGLIRDRLLDYQYEYTVYDEIIILDIKGNVIANLDANNKVSHSSDSLLNKTQAVDLHSDKYSDKYIETFRHVH